MDKIRINLRDILLTVSSAMDLIHTSLSNHHQQVAYLSFKLAEQLNYPLSEQKEIFLAALVHDIGALSENERLEIIETEPRFINSHAFNGAKLLDEFKPMQDEANIIRYHHLPWNHGEGLFYEGEKVPISSHVIHVADRFCLKIKSQQNILSQLLSIFKSIAHDKGTLFEPSMVDALYALSKKEYIWLDLTSDYPVRKLPRGLFDTLILDVDDIIGLSLVFSHIIDFRSKFTARHSAGVAKTAQKLAELVGFSPLECKNMLIAGYLHDLGKLVIRSEILEKPAKLNADEFNEIRSHTYYTYQLLDKIPQFEIIKEWASYHHEKLNGKGYPFKVDGSRLTLGARIMAVADVFTAITENRPYRKGMDDTSAINILKKMVAEDAIDDYVVSVLLHHFQEVNTIREEAQQNAAEKYEAFLKQKQMM